MSSLVQETRTHPQLADSIDSATFAHHAQRHWFVCVISNPQRYKTRYELYMKFRRHIIDELGANLVTVEAAFGVRDFMVSEYQIHDDLRHSNAPAIEHIGTKQNKSTEKAFDPCFNGTGNDGYEVVYRSNRHIHVQIRHNTELWVKESLMNIGLRYLPVSCEYVTFADADIRFLRNDIVHEIVHGLQHYTVLQPWSTAIDLGPDGDLMGAPHTSFACKYASGCPLFTFINKASGDSTSAELDLLHSGDLSPYEYEYEYMERGMRLDRSFHPGYALSWRKSALNDIGGMIDICALGSGDMHAMYSIIGMVEYSFIKGLSEGYRQAIRNWAERVEQVVERNLGHIKGSIIETGFHGRKANRQYGSRWTILTSEKFDPNKHLTRNIMGLWELRSGFPALRDKLRNYFISRNEDSNA